jgi:hypothetical protein
VGVGVAEVDPDGVAPVDLDERQEPLLDLGERLVPADLDERAVPLDQRPPEPVGVLLELAEGRPLGADEPVTEHVVAVAADARDSLGAVAADEADLQATAGLAERAGAERGAGLGVGHAAMVPPPAPAGRLHLR